jgi:hypothetical protein
MVLDLEASLLIVRHTNRCPSLCQTLQRLTRRSNALSYVGSRMALLEADVNFRIIEPQ